MEKSNHIYKRVPTNIMDEIHIYSKKQTNIILNKLKQCVNIIDLNNQNIYNVFDLTL